MVEKLNPRSGLDAPRNTTAVPMPPDCGITAADLDECFGPDPRSLGNTSSNFQSTRGGPENALNLPSNSKTRATAPAGSPPTAELISLSTAMSVGETAERQVGLVVQDLVTRRIQYTGLKPGSLTVDLLASFNVPEQAARKIVKKAITPNSHGQKWDLSVAIELTRQLHRDSDPSMAPNFDAGVHDMERHTVEILTAVDLDRKNRLHLYDACKEARKKLESQEKLIRANLTYHKHPLHKIDLWIDDHTELKELRDAVNSLHRQVIQLPSERAKEITNSEGSVNQPTGQ